MSRRIVQIGMILVFLALSCCGSDSNPSGGSGLPSDSTRSPGGSSGTSTSVVPWGEAARHIGKHVTLEGVFESTHNSGKACFLNFSSDYRSPSNVYCVIFKSDFPKFESSPERAFRGKKVQVTGVVETYQGKPQIKVNDPSQIKIIK